MFNNPAVEDRNSDKPCRLFGAANLLLKNRSFVNRRENLSEAVTYRTGFHGSRRKTQFFKHLFFFSEAPCESAEDRRGFIGVSPLIVKGIFRLT